MKNMRVLARGISVLLLVVGVCGLTFSQTAAALVGAHSYMNGTNGDVFLGGDYIEVGVSKYGSFGTSTGQALPSGFYGTAARSNVGMSTNPAGFGVAPDLRMDFFLPGTPEERWAVGYKIAGTPSVGSNAFLRGSTNISNYTVNNESTSSKLQSTGNGSFNSTLDITQVVSFSVSDKFFKNEVTLKNISGSAIDSVRYMRSFDPDNTVDKGGSHSTQNQILYTHAGGDDKAVVMADTSNNASDPVFAVNGSRSPILFYSADSRARVSTFGFANSDPYASQAYDSPSPKGTSNTADGAITITFDVGTLAPNASQTITYYTSLDNRDFSEVISDIEEDAGPADDNDGVAAEIEAAAPNSGDGNGDGTQDSEQANVSSLPNAVVGGGAYQTLKTENCDTISSLSVGSVSSYGSDGAYQYPVGLADFTIDCATAGETATVTFYYDKQYDTSKWVARKYQDGSFSNIPGASFGSATVGGNTVTTLTYQVTDGGALDDDGVANGTIVDPAGPAIAPSIVLTSGTSNPLAPSTGLPVSDRSSWLAYGALALILMGIGVYGHGFRVATRKS